MARDCNCNKPAPLGRPVPKPAEKSLVASQGSTSGIIHVAPNGTRTQVGDLLAARAAVIRFGGGIENV